MFLQDFFIMGTCLFCHIFWLSVDILLVWGLCLEYSSFDLKRTIAQIIYQNPIKKVQKQARPHCTLAKQARPHCTPIAPLFFCF